MKWWSLYNSVEKLKPLTYNLWLNFKAHKSYLNKAEENGEDKEVTANVLSQMILT